MWPHTPAPAGRVEPVGDGSGSIVDAEDPVLVIRMRESLDTGTCAAMRTHSGARGAEAADTGIGTIALHTDTLAAAIRTEDSSRARTGR